MKFGIFLGNAGRNSGGPEIYESELVRSLARIDKQNQYEIFCLDRRAPSVVGVDQENFRYHVLWPAVRPVSMTVSLALASSRYKTQSLHATFMPPVFSPQPLILTLVCFSMFARPEYYPLAIRLRVQALTRLGLRTARYFLCVSNNVRELFADKFKIAEKRLLLSYMAASDIFHPIPEEDVRAEVAERFLIKDPYFLFSGRWEHRKNIVGTIQAFALFKKRTGIDGEPHMGCGRGSARESGVPDGARDYRSGQVPVRHPAAALRRRGSAGIRVVLGRLWHAAGRVNGLRDAGDHF
jgi:glycosyltransferase involved in cell wall biosynthesis